MKYILEGKKAIPCDNVLQWAQWFEKADRIVEKTKISEGVEVSTVFLGIDHAFCGGKPLLFETMVFGGKLDQEQQRYSTWEEAEQGHKEMVNRVNAS